MSNNLLFLIPIFLFFLSCDKEEEIIVIEEEKVSIPFEGIWTRQFEAGPGNLHDVKYSIYQDSIRYLLSGPIGNANYLMHRDTFLLEDNRYIGHTPESKYYLIFVKNISSDSITIYKQTLESIEEGLTTEIPPANTTANHGWNTFKKQ